MVNDMVALRVFVTAENLGMKMGFSMAFYLVSSTVAHLVYDLADYWVDHLASKVVSMSDETMVVTFVSLESSCTHYRYFHLPILSYSYTY